MLCWEKQRNGGKHYFFILLMSVVNSYILFKSLPGNAKVTQKDFRKRLVLEILQQGGQTSTSSRTTGILPESSVRVDHCPVPISECTREKASKATHGRKNCKLCFLFYKNEQKSPWKCEKCNVPLCLQLDRNCFKPGILHATWWTKRMACTQLMSKHVLLIVDKWPTFFLIRVQYNNFLIFPPIYWI